jgi:hypothetical protein
MFLNDTYAEHYAGNEVNAYGISMHRQIPAAILARMRGEPVICGFDGCRESIHGATRYISGLAHHPSCADRKQGRSPIPPTVRAESDRVIARLHGIAPGVRPRRLSRTQS